jgi:hypothetical protein
MGIVYLFVLLIAGAVGAALGAFIGLTIGLMSSPLTFAFTGLIGGGFLGVLAGLIYVIHGHRQTFR